MSISDIRRDHQLIKLTMAVDGDTEYKTTEALNVTGYSGGTVFFPATWTAATLAVMAATTQTGTFVTHRYLDSSAAETLTQIGDATTKPAATEPWALPAHFFTAGPWVKLQSQDGAETAVDQTASREIWLFLKG